MSRPVLDTAAMLDAQPCVTELDAAELVVTSGGGLWSWLFGEPTTGWGGGSSGGGGASSSW